MMRVAGCHLVLKIILAQSNLCNYNNFSSHLNIRLISNEDFPQHFFFTRNFIYLSIDKVAGYPPETKKKTQVAETIKEHFLFRFNHAIL